MDETTLIKRIADGDTAAVDRLMPAVYDALRDLANRYLHDAPGGSLQPTALVHEVYLKLINAEAVDARGQSHFYAIAARAMRQVLVDHLRGHGRAKRGGGWQRLTLRGLGGGWDSSVVDLEATHAALDELAALDERAAAIVVMRFFGGLSEVQIAEVLGVTDRTVRADWRMARAWLRRRLGDGAEAAS
jgi:RNA polymerase sigma factor (TIGR02999 family)